MKWIDKREEPEILRKTQIGAVRLMSVKTATSAAYKGMISIILKHGAKDFIRGSLVNFADSTEIHHIFPKKFCVAKNIPKERFDNIANRTPILKATNKIIGGDAPSMYLPEIERKAKLSGAEVDEILELHLADAELCRTDNFGAFIVDRAKKILDAVEKLTGRKVVGRDSPEIKSRFGASLS